MRPMPPSSPRSLVPAISRSRRSKSALVGPQAASGSRIRLARTRRMQTPEATTPQGCAALRAAVKSRRWRPLHSCVGTARPVPFPACPKCSRYGPTNVPVGEALRLLVFLFCATLLVLGQFGRTFEDSERYGYLTDIMPSDWAATNVWLASSSCALERGVWLAVCEKGKLVPISERAIADDPGHALLLDLWSMATRSRATLPDVARLTSIVLMWLGPVEYVGWMGTSPHWSYIGLVSMSAVLPITLAAKDLGLLSRRVGNLWIAAGLLFLALATLAR